MNRTEDEKYPKLNRPEAEFKTKNRIVRIRKKIVKYIENLMLKLAWKPTP
jgi:hypothetical protein